jgi:hypothetical protein
VALLERLCEEDYTRITAYNRNNKRILFFNELVRCFTPVSHTCHGTIDTCICGKFPIVENYVIGNIKTKEELIVGSTCAKNWFYEINGDSCIYCSRNKKKGGNCINCSGKKNLKSVFSAWKSITEDRKNERERIERTEIVEECRRRRIEEMKRVEELKEEREMIESMNECRRERMEAWERNARDMKDEWNKYASDKKDERERIETMELNEKVSFGMYKHLTYMQLCSDESIGKVKYVKWCLEESGMKDSITSRLRYFYNKHSIQNIQ